MSIHHLRHDPVCQNCGHTVEERYCSHCGQENIETRQTFGHLVRHFLEDITHYDNSFWRTFKYLMFRPAYLTKAYLAGKRNSYLPPVRLYIFVSFVAFFLPYLLPDNTDHFEQPIKKAQVENEQNAKFGIGLNFSRGRFFYAQSEYKTIAQLDSVQRALPPEKRQDAFDYWTTKKTIELSRYSEDELEDKFLDAFAHNFPKALFVYMPLFALIIWLFHNKKRWYYFDHAIFTIHYFSFVLLAVSLLNIINALLLTPLLFTSERSAVNFAMVSLIVTFLWVLIYFFRAHRNMFGEKRSVSFIKSLATFSINYFLLFILVVGLGLITVMNLH